MPGRESVPGRAAPGVAGGLSADLAAQAGVRGGRFHWAAFGLILLLAGVLRFVFLGRPGIWGDEAATYGRVNGSFYQLLEVLRFDGFAPLHYELYFWLARHVVLDPVMMRLWPAIAGFGTVPAMYFLARQFFDRRVALTTMLLAACSAYLLYYSRDAKMYAPLWLFCTLSAGCLFAWLNGGGRVYFLLWILCTTAAGGIHAPGLMVLALVPVAMVLHLGRSGWKRWWGRAAMVLVGTAVILAGPAYHYLTFNQWAERIESVGWRASMLNWVEEYNEGRDLPQLARYTATAYAFGWEWPDMPDLRAKIDPRVLSACEWAAIGIGAALVAGCVPWGRVWRRVRVGGRAGGGRGERAVPVTLPGEGDGAFSPVARFVLLAVWVVLPAYATYVISVADAGSPWRLLPWLLEGGLARWGVAAVVAGGVALSLRGRREWAWAVGGVVGVFVLLAVVYYGVRFHRGHDVGVVWGWPFVEVASRPAREVNSVWMPRYLGVIVPAVVLLAGYVLARLPVGVRHVAIAGVVAVNLANYGAKLYIDPEPPVGRMVAEVWEDAHAATPTTPLVFLQGGMGPGFQPGVGTVSGVVGRYYVSIRLNPPMDPPTFRRDWGPARSLTLAYFLPQRTDTRTKAMRAALASRPQADVVEWVYDGLRDAKRAVSSAERTLGKTWAVVSRREYPSYDHWVWAPRTVTTRYEFKRVAAPTSGPSEDAASGNNAATRPIGGQTVAPGTRPGGKAGVPPAAGAGLPATTQGRAGE